MSGLLTRLGDYSLPWYQLRGRGATLVAADDTPIALGTSTGNWANKPSVPSLDGWDTANCVPAVSVNVPQTSAGKISTAQIIGYGTDAANETCNWILYAYRGLNSPAIRVATGVAILGAMDLVTEPVTGATITGFYVDTWGITTDYWGQVTVKDDAADACSILTFDLRGFTFLYFEIDIPASTQVASFGAAFSGV